MVHSFAVPAPAQSVRTSPFEQVLEHEEQHEARVRDAEATLEQERQAEEDAIRAEQNATVDQARAKGREELIAFKNTHLPNILKQGEEQAAHEVARIEREGSARVAAAAKHVVDLALSPNFPSLL
jgi:hypothetical protein